MKHLKIFGLLLLLAGCSTNSSVKNSASVVDDKEGSTKTTVTVGVPNQAFYNEFLPIFNCLNKRLKKSRLKIVPALSFVHFTNQVNEKQYDLTILNGLMALEAAKNGYNIQAKFSNDSSYYGVIFVKKGSGLRTIKDLEGKKIAIAGKGTVFGDIAPLLFLSKNGLDVEKKLNRIYVSSFETSILHVFLGKCDIGTSWYTMWNNYLIKHPEIRENLEVVWTTPHYPNVAIVSRKGLDSLTTKEIIDEMLALHESEEGKQVLKRTLSGKIVRADSNVYKSMELLNKEYKQALKKK